ncbi:MAG TPA: sterol-binding protein [Gammaproteobacteria bacterium]|nr:sterol-binding protein [Gammaproteobacteria bacterium]
MVLPLLATAALEKALNHCLQMDPETLTQVTRLEGKVIALVMVGLGKSIYLVPTADGLRVQSIFEGEPDVTIKGGVFSLARLGLSDDPASVFGDGVEMVGDAQLGRKVQHILASLELDWEEQLSRLSGDVVAHQVGNTVRDLFGWGGKTVETLGRDVAEYLQEESRDLVVKPELDQFLDRVDTLRSDVDRLVQRVKRLQGQSKSNGANQT